MWSMYLAIIATTGKGLNGTDSNLYVFTLSVESSQLLASSCSILWAKQTIADSTPGIIDADLHPSLSCKTLQAFTSN